MQDKRIRVSEEVQNETRKDVLRVRFNTQTDTINGSLEELRNRARKSPAFLRLLKLAAYGSMTKRPVLLSASNRPAMRALRIALAGVSRNTCQVPTLGKSYRTVYEMNDGRAWREVSKQRADEVRNKTTPDSLAVREVIAYHPKITWGHAALLDRKTHGEIHAAIRDVINTQRADSLSRWQEARERNARNGDGAHAGSSDEYLEYNDAGELETPEERTQRLTARLPRETWENAERHISAYLTKTPEAKAPPRVIELAAAPFYQSSADKVKGAAAIIRDAEQEAQRLNRLELDTDAAEVESYSDLDEFLAQEDLEHGMRTPAEALAAAGF